MTSVSPKKYLGQHFLLDEQIAQQIVGALRAEKTGSVIEIGPGTGILTKYLMAMYPKLEAFDVDQDSIDYLKAKYPEQSSHFVLQDFLNYDLNQYNRPIHVIGNFPYNISSQLFFRIWDNRNLVDEVVCMIQKEVADRIVSGPGNKTYGILSVLLQAFYHTEMMFYVAPHVFKPPPKVQSAVIRLKRNDTEKLGCDEMLFRKVVKAGFGKRRKTLRNALKDLNLKFSTEEAVFNKRAEQLSVNDFVGLTNHISL